MATSIFSLFGEIFVKNEKANEAIDETDEKAENTSGTLGKLGGVAGRVGGLIAAGVAVGATAMVGLVGKTMEAANQINKFSQVTGMSTKGFQEWDHVAKSVGFSMEAAAGDMAALAERAMDAASGAGENAEMFKKLGVTVTDNNGKLKTQEQLFNETIKGLQGMEDVTERNAIATAMLSTTGEELAPILNMTNEELQKLKGSANVISDDNLAKAADFNSKWIEAKTTLEGLGMTIGIALMPMLGNLVQGIQWVINVVAQWFASNESTLNGMKNKFLEVMPMVKNIAEVAFRAIWAVVRTVWNFFKTALLPIFVSLYSWIQGHMPTIRSVVEVVFRKISEVVRGLWSVFVNDLLPILTRLFQWIQSKIPTIKNIVEIAFRLIVAAVKLVWGVFENVLLPVLKKLWDWVSPYIPKVQNIIEKAFDAIFWAVDAVVGVFDDVVTAIENAIDWLSFWDDKKVKKKTIEVEERRTYSGGRPARNATGTNYFQGGATLVGEMGPELVHLPRGTKIDPANETRNKLKGGGDTYITVHSQKAIMDERELMRTMQRLEVLYG